MRYFLRCLLLFVGGKFLNVSTDTQSPPCSPLGVSRHQFKNLCFPIKCWCYLQKFMSYSLNLMSFIFPTWSEENIATQMIKQREIVDVSRWISSSTSEIRLGKRGVCLPDTDKVITHNTLYIFSFFFSEHCTIMSCEATEHQSRSHIAVVWTINMHVRVRFQRPWGSLSVLLIVCVAV